MSARVLTLEYLASIIENDPTSLLFARYAFLLNLHGEQGKALAVCEEGVMAHPDYVAGRLLLAQLYLDEGKFDGAVLHLIEAIKVEPDNAKAIRMMAQAYEQQGATDKTEKLYTLLNHREPQNKVLKKRTVSSVIVPVISILGLEINDTTEYAAAASSVEIPEPATSEGGWGDLDMSGEGEATIAQPMDMPAADTSDIDAIIGDIDLNSQEQTAGNENPEMSSELDDVMADLETDLDVLSEEDSDDIDALVDELNADSEGSLEDIAPADPEATITETVPGESTGGDLDDLLSDISDELTIEQNDAEVDDLVAELTSEPAVGTADNAEIDDLVAELTGSDETTEESEVISNDNIDDLVAEMTAETDTAEAVSNDNIDDLVAEMTAESDTAEAVSNDNIDDLVAEMTIESEVPEAVSNDNIDDFIAEAVQETADEESHVPQDTIADLAHEMEDLLDTVTHSDEAIEEMALETIDTESISNDSIDELVAETTLEVEESHVPEDTIADLAGEMEELLNSVTGGEIPVQVEENDDIAIDELVETTDATADVMSSSFEDLVADIGADDNLSDESLENLVANIGNDLSETDLENSEFTVDEISPEEILTTTTSDEETDFSVDEIVTNETLIDSAESSDELFLDQEPGTEASLSEFTVDEISPESYLASPESEISTDLSSSVDEEHIVELTEEVLGSEPAIEVENTELPTVDSSELPEETDDVIESVQLPYEEPEEISFDDLNLDPEATIAEAVTPEHMLESASGLTVESVDHVANDEIEIPADVFESAESVELESHAESLLDDLASLSVETADSSSEETPQLNIDALVDESVETLTVESDSLDESDLQVHTIETPSDMTHLESAADEISAHDDHHHLHTEEFSADTIKSEIDKVNIETSTLPSDEPVDEFHKDHHEVHGTEEYEAETVLSAIQEEAGEKTPEIVPETGLTESVEQALDSHTGGLERDSGTQEFDPNTIASEPAPSSHSEFSSVVDSLAEGIESLIGDQDELLAEFNHSEPDNEPANPMRFDDALEAPTITHASHETEHTQEFDLNELLQDAGVIPQENSAETTSIPVIEDSHEELAMESHLTTGHSESRTDEFDPSQLTEEAHDDSALDSLVDELHVATLTDTGTEEFNLAAIIGDEESENTTADESEALPFDMEEQLIGSDTDDLFSDTAFVADDNEPESSNVVEELSAILDEALTDTTETLSESPLEMDSFETTEVSEEEEESIEITESFEPVQETTEIDEELQESSEAVEEIENEWREDTFDTEPEEEPLPFKEGDSLPDHVLTPTFADIYLQQEQPHLAKQIYERLLEKEPENDLFKERIDEIETFIALHPELEMRHSEPIDELPKRTLEGKRINPSIRKKLQNKRKKS